MLHLLQAVTGHGTDIQEYLELVKCRLRALKTGVEEEKQYWNKTTGNMQNKLLGQASA